MGRTPCCSKVGLNRGAWTATEDKILRDYIKVHGEGKWRNLPKIAGLKRCGKSCRLRWLNYLRPDIKRGNITRDEEELITRLHNLLGNRWSLIAGRLPGRTDNEIKNYWNTYLGKKLRSGHQSSDHDLAATSINTTSSDPSKTTSSYKILHKLPQPTLNKTTPSRSTAQQLVELPYSKSKTTTPNYVPAVRTKVHRLTKVTLLPDQDPQNPPPLDHDNSSKPAVDTVQPPPSTVNDKVNKIYANDQMVAGTGLDHDNDQLLVPVVGLPTEDESNNSSQLFMAHINQDHDHFEITEDDKKFLSDFLNVDCLDLELANLFGNGEHDSCNNIINKGFEDDTLLFSDQDHMALFGLSATELQSGTTSTTTAFSD